MTPDTAIHLHNEAKMGLFTEYFLNDKWFVSHFLHGDTRELTERVYLHGSEFERHIVAWCVENLVPLERIRSNWIVTTYEEFIINTG